MRSANDEKLIAEFVAAFDVLDDLTVWSKDQTLPSELEAGFDDSRWAWQKWKPAKIRTSRAALDHFLSTYGIRFPELYENLLLSFRWLEVDLCGLARLFENPPGPLAEGLFAAIVEGPIHSKVLLPSGLVPFARAPDNYDLICFDTTNRSVSRDFPLVQIDHEELLCCERILKRCQLWQTFRSFAEAVVATANQKRSAGSDIMP
jgi:hypothetical protein